MQLSIFEMFASRASNNKITYSVIYKKKLKSVKEA